MDKDAIFRIFSMSKLVCGAAILMLLEEGKVRLNDPVSRFLPEFKGSKVAVDQDRPRTANASDPPKYYTIPAAREITIQDPLTHVSGLASGGRASSHELQGLMDFVGGRTLADIMPNFAAAPLDFEPGSRWTYSPLAGFDTLGRVIEVASGNEVRSVPERADLHAARHEDDGLPSGRRALVERCDSLSPSRCNPDEDAEPEPSAE
jgi:CubicO group peptidase (beta-lactamase class C family)